MLNCGMSPDVRARLPAGLRFGPGGRTMRAWLSWTWMLAVLSLLAGCGTHGSANWRKTGGASAKTNPAGDLSRDLDLNTWAVNTSGEEPLSIAEHLAKTAGGTWVALAPHP